MSNTAERRGNAADTALILQRLDQIDRRADERHTAVMEKLTDHEERIRTLERGQSRGILADGGNVVYTTLASVIQYLLMQHRGP